VAITDVFDALTSARSYKPALPPGEALRIIRNSSGTQFDPAIVDTFLNLWPGIEPYFHKFRDAPRPAVMEPVGARAAPCEPAGVDARTGNVALTT
jgi:putative two-component system response regulator